MKKIFYILIVSLFVLVKPAFAQTNQQSNQAQSPKEMIWQSPIDRRVEITLMSGKTIEGRLTFKQPLYCIIAMDPDQSPYLIHYSSIKAVRIHKERIRKLKLIAFEVLKAPIYLVFSSAQVSYWVAQEIFEDICRIGKSK